MASPTWAATTLTCGGQVFNAQDGTSVNGGLWQVYNPSQPSLMAEGVAGEYASQYWAGEVGASLGEYCAVGDQLVVVVQKETNPDSLSHNGYFAAVGQVLSNNDPFQFATLSLAEIPEPQGFVTGPNQIELTWQSVTNAYVAGYNVYRSADGLSFSKRNSSPIVDTSFTDTQVPQTTTVYYTLSLVYEGNPEFRNEVLSSHSQAMIQDSDGDGLMDVEEDVNGNGVVDEGETDPHNPDTDGDGMPDGWEVENNLDPLFDDADQDPDGDGISNLDEYLNGSDPNYNENDNKALPWIMLLLID